MRRWAFVVFMLGMLVLIGVMIFNVKEVRSLEGLEDNQHVKLNGLVVSERGIYDDEKILELDSGIVLVCEGCGSYLDKEIFVEGIVEEYKGEKQIRVLRIIP